MKNLAKSVIKIASEAYAANGMDLSKAYRSVVGDNDNLYIARDMILLELQATVDNGGCLEIGEISSLIFSLVSDLGLNDPFNKQKVINKVIEEI